MTSNMHRLAIVLSLLLAGVATADDFPGFPLANVRVIDGDTVEADILLPWNVTLREQHIRAADYDAWEASKRRRSVEVTDVEVARGKKATEELRRLTQGTTIHARPGTEPRDSYGRILARLFFSDGEDLRSVADFMRSRGHLRTGGNE